MVLEKLGKQFYTFLCDSSLCVWFRKAILNFLLLTTVAKHQNWDPKTPCHPLDSVRKLSFQFVFARIWSQAPKLLEIELLSPLWPHRWPSTQIGIVRPLAIRRLRSENWVYEITVANICGQAPKIRAIKVLSLLLPTPVAKHPHLDSNASLPPRVCPNMGILRPTINEWVWNEFWMNSELIHIGNLMSSEWVLNEFLVISIPVRVL
jgi:hypothetical protein